MPKNNIVYVAVLIDKYGVQLYVRPTLEEVQDGLIDRINNEYSTDIISISELREWACVCGATTTIYYLNTNTMDVIEECI